MNATMNASAEFTTETADEARLIRFTIKRYFRWAPNSRIDYDDMVQAGWIAAMRARADYRHDGGATYASFLVGRVRAEIADLVDRGFTCLSTKSHHFTNPAAFTGDTIAAAHAGMHASGIDSEAMNGPHTAANHIRDVDDRDEAQHAFAAIDRADLNDTQRRIIALIRLGREVSEIASEIGITESGVRFARDRAIAKIQAAL